MKKLLKNILSSPNVESGWISVDEIKNRYKALELEKQIIEIDDTILIMSCFSSNPSNGTLFFTKNGITLEWDLEGFYLECVGIDISNFKQLKNLYKNLYWEELNFNAYDYWKYKNHQL